MNLLYLKGMLPAIIELLLGEVKVVMLVVNNGLCLLVIKFKCSHYHYIQFQKWIQLAEWKQEVRNKFQTQRSQLKSQSPVQ